MPHTAGITSEGVFKPLSSSTPEVSSAAWASVITGANPGVHGIFGFTELTSETYKMRFPNYNDLKAAPFWEQWAGRSVVIDLWSCRRAASMEKGGLLRITLHGTSLVGAEVVNLTSNLLAVLAGSV